MGFFFFYYAELILLNYKLAVSTLLSPLSNWVDIPGGSEEHQMVCCLSALTWRCSLPLVISPAVVRCRELGVRLHLLHEHYDNSVGFTLCTTVGDQGPKRPHHNLPMNEAQLAVLQCSLLTFGGGVGWVRQDVYKNEQ